jgi:hypothetical protein
VILYLGDHDPSGHNIERDIAARILSHMDAGEPLEIVRVAIHREDIERFNLPPLGIKLSDTRAGKFLKRCGRQCVEVDALPPSELRERLSIAILGLIDDTAWQRAIMVEPAEQETPRKVAAALRCLPTQGDGGFQGNFAVGGFQALSGGPGPHGPLGES